MVNPDGTFDAALLMRQSGSIIAGWMQQSDRIDAVGVMTATLLASVDTIVEMVGRRTPTTVSVRCEESQILATRIDDKAVLVLIAPETTREAHLRRKTRQIVARLASASRSQRTGAIATPALTSLATVVGRASASGDRETLITVPKQPGSLRNSAGKMHAKIVPTSLGP